MPDTLSDDRSAILAARERLRGRLQPAPWLRAPFVPGLGAVPGLSLFVDSLQPSGSAWVRGALLFLIDRFGERSPSERPDLAVHGKPRWLLAWAAAAHLQGQRIEVHTEERFPLDGLWQERLEAIPGVIRRHHPDLQTLHLALEDRGRAGVCCTPDLSDRSVHLGLASLGCEVGEALSAPDRGSAGDEPELVLVGPGPLAIALRAGLTAVGVSAVVTPVQRDEFDEQERRALQERLRVHLRLDVGPGAAVAFGLGLLRASEGRRVCVVMGG